MDADSKSASAEDALVATSTAEIPLATAAVPNVRLMVTVPVARAHFHLAVIVAMAGTTLVPMARAILVLPFVAVIMVRMLVLFILGFDRGGDHQASESQRDGGQTEQ